MVKVRITFRKYVVELEPSMTAEEARKNCEELLRKFPQSIKKCEVIE